MKKLLTLALTGVLAFGLAACGGGAPSNAASSGSACTAGSLDPSHVLLALGRPYELANSGLRLTINELNTAEEIDTIIAAVSESVETLRRLSPAWKDLTEGKREFLLK